MLIKEKENKDNFYFRYLDTLEQFLPYLIKRPHLLDKAKMCNSA